jgi:hypothetical protein
MTDRIEILRDVLITRGRWPSENTRPERRLTPREVGMSVPTTMPPT